jgi:hypothetical protein
MSLKTSDVMTRTVQCEEKAEDESVPDVTRRVTATESHIRERYEWHMRQSFSWRAVILVLTSDRSCVVAAKHRASVNEIVKMELRSAV